MIYSKTMNKLIITIKTISNKQIIVLQAKQLKMGNELAKLYQIQQKPIKLPSPYNFLRYLIHPYESSYTLLLVKFPHKATLISSTVILPINEFRVLSEGTVTKSPPAKPLFLLKGLNESEHKLIIYQLIKLKAELGRCFLCNGRVMVWSEQKRENKRIFNQIFCLGINLANYLSYVQEGQIFYSENQNQNKQKGIKKQNQEVQLKQKLIKKLKITKFYIKINDDLKQVLLSLMEQKPLEHVLNLKYFTISKQLHLYEVLCNQIQNMEASQKILFMKSLQILCKQGLTIQKNIMKNYFVPVFLSFLQRIPSKNILYVQTISVLIECDQAPKQILNKTFNTVQITQQIAFLFMEKRKKLQKLLLKNVFQSILLRTISAAFDYQKLQQNALSIIPYCIINISNSNLKQQLQRIVIGKIINVKHPLFLHGIKCIIHLLQQELITTHKLLSLIFQPRQISVQINMHILYMYGLMIENLKAQQLMKVMMPKLQLYLADAEINNSVFIVANKCLKRIIQRLFQQRKLSIQEDIVIQKRKQFFQIALPQLNQKDLQEEKQNVKNAIQKYSMQQIQWVTKVL